MNILEKAIQDRGWLLADGATGSNFFNRGLESGYPPDLWNTERPEEVTRLHRQFLEAGSDLILTNTFGANAPRLKLHNAQDQTREINMAAASLARQAVEEHGSGLVAGSIGPTGELFEPMGALTHETTYEFFQVQAQALADGGVDVLWIETMSCLHEVRAAVEAAQSTGLPVVATLSFDTAKRTMMGITPEEYVDFGKEVGLNAQGANCGVGPAELMQSVQQMIEAECPIPVVAKGNCGVPAYVNGELDFRGTPELMADYALIARSAGATIIGGCCGTTPQHIEAMSIALKSNSESPSIDALGAPWADLPTGKTRKRARSVK